MIDEVRQTRTRSAGAAWAGWVAGILVIASLGIGCSRSDTSKPEPSSAAKPSANTSAAADAKPEWIERSKSWPDTLRFTFDSTLEIVQDGLLLRLRPAVSQDTTGKSFQNERPLQCSVLMTVRPVPEWPLAKGLVLDSIIFYDPVKKRNLRAVPMLAFQRTYSEQTVRTQFLPNMADAYRQSPDLAGTQDLVPTIYLSWDGRIIIASMPPLTLTYAEETSSS